MKKTCKSIFRRTLSFMVTAAMCLSLLPAAAFAADGESTGEAADSIVQVDTTPEVPAEQQTEPSENGEEPSEPEPAEGEGETEDETQQPEPSEVEEQPSEPETTEGEGEEDKTQTSQPEETPSDDEEKEEPADHVHNEDGWSCAWSECIHEHGPECYVPGEDGGEDVLNCAHVCGEECLANTEGFWICTEPEEEPPVYATVEELEAAFEAVSETDDVDEAIAAIDEYLRIFDLLSPEDQEANAEAKEAALAYRQTLADAKEAEENGEDCTDPEINALGNTSSNQTVYFKTVRVYNVNTYEEFTFDVGTNFPVHMSNESYNSVSWTIPELSKFLAKSSLYSGYTYTMAQSWNSPNLYGVYSSGFTAQTGGQNYHQPGSTAEVVMNHPQNKTIIYYVTKFTPGSSGTGGNKDEDFTYGDGKYSLSATVKYHSNYPDGTDYVVTQNIKLNMWTPNPPWNVLDFPFKSYSACKFGGYATKDSEETWYTNSTCTEKQDSTLVVTKNGDIIHLYAGWKTEEGEKKDPVKLTYMDRNEQYGKTESYVPGTDVLISDCTKTYANHTFEGWDTDPSADEVVYNKGDSFTIEKDTILYAVWKSIASNPGTQSGNFTVKKSFSGLDTGVAVPNVTLSYEAYRTKDDIMVGTKETGNVVLTLNGNEYTGTITPTVWNMGNISNAERPHYKNIVVITEDLDSAKVNGYIWKSFEARYPADGTNVGNNSVKFTIDGATFGKTLSVKNSYTKDTPKTREIPVTPTVVFRVNGNNAEQLTWEQIPENYTLKLTYTDQDGPQEKIFTLSDVGVKKDLDSSDCPRVEWPLFKVKIADVKGTTIPMAVTQSAYLIGDNDNIIYEETYTTDGGRNPDASGTINVSQISYSLSATTTNFYKLSNPKLAGIEKELVGVTVNGETADVNKLSVTKDDVVVLRYKITVTGDEGAKYTVEDEGAALGNGSSWSGTLDSSKKAEIFVTKTVTATEAGTLTVTNTAYVKPGEGTDPVDPNDPDKGHPSEEVEIDIPVKEPNPKLTGITKRLVLPEGLITVKRGESVELVYEISVTGEKGAKYEVSDPEAGDTTWKGTIDESGKAVITVSKTITPTDEQKGTITVKNTAYVKPDGDGTDPIKPGDPDPDKDPTDPEKGYPSNEVETEITIIEPNPKLKSIVKKLVTPEPITVRVGENVTLEYTITITGDEGAEYKVTDDGAELKDGSSWDGKLGESGEAVITVTKTVTPTEAGTMTVENTAFVKPGEGTDPIKPVDPENPDEPVEPEPSNTVTTDITVTDGREITITWLRNYSRDDETIIKRDQRVPANITSDEIGARYPGEDQIPNREGYEFIGWGERVTDELGNITIRAQWRYVGPSGPTTPTGPTDPTPGDSDTDDDSDPDPDPDPTPVRRVTVNVPDAPTPLAEIGETPVPLASNPSDLIDIFDDDVPLAGGVGTGNNDALWYLLAALSLAGLGIMKLLEKKNTTK